MPKGLLLGEDEKVYAWAKHAFQLFPMAVDRALGVVDSNGTLLGAILFRNFNGFNVELSYYGPRTLTPGIVRSIARITLLDYKASRLTVVTSKKKRRLIKSLTGIGFRLEGSQQCYYGVENCRKNTAVRLVAFREDLAKVAGINALHPATGLQR